jgi:hypothetical protein
MKFEEMKQAEMRCEEAAEFVSALCDGETIPRSAAAHIGNCQACSARLSQYAQMGAELRRVASLQTEETRTPLWQQAQRITPHWWQKGWETMRIPRFAFALLLAAVVVLGSSLTIVKVRAHTQGKALLLTSKTASGSTLHCLLSMGDKKFNSCEHEEANDKVVGLYGFRFISRDGDRVQLGVRAERGPNLGFSTAGVDKLPETPYWFQPGETLKIDVPGEGTMAVTGEWLDYMPPLFSTAMGARLDPDTGELRFYSPVLLRGKEVLCDFGPMNVSGSSDDEGIELYAPHDGRYEISLSPLEGAVEGRIDASRISFELNGQAYKILTGAPIARADRIWVLHLPGNKQSQTSDGDNHASVVASDGEDHGSVSYVSMAQYLAKRPETK